MSTKTRNKVRCDCKTCNGRLVDERTRNKHAELENRLASRVSGFEPANNPLFSNSSITNPSATPDQSNITNTTLDVDYGPVIEGSESRNLPNDANYEPVFVDFEQHNIPQKKRRRQNQFRETEVILDDQHNEVSNSSSGESFDRSVNKDESESDIPSDNDDLFLSDNEIPVEQFTAPDYDSNSESEYPDTNIRFADSWILVWLFKYQARFRLSDVAIDALIKFFQQVLKDADQARFEKFPSSAYTARKLLQFGKRSKIYAVCPSCNTLYSTAKVVAEEGFKCTHIEFPMRSKTKPCGMELTIPNPLTYQDKRRPKLLFPLPNLKIQINSLYQRPGFEQQLQKWINRNIDEELMADIFDGKIWKIFPSESAPFFTPETADRHLGIMINLDWFQPFESSVYSCGAIYGVICNLPREVRFRKENMLTLGLLPGPNEVKLHKINHYLFPIVDELLEFWNGVEIPAAGKNIRLALICCSNDIPAARKLCGHISASVSCHRCYKRANSSGNKLNFGGFDDMDDWFIERNLEEHRQNAENWRLCKSEEERKSHVSSTLARWTELLRLPYFNPIRYLVVDPMHCLFLGIARWIIKKLWIDGNKITKRDLEKMEKRAKTITLPANIGRLPNKIATGEGFSGFTADQWKTFILIYAIPLMWDLLAKPDQKILGNFARACSLLVGRIINYNALNEAHERLLKVATLIEENYGPEMITPNLHLCLHIADCCRDYGPLYSFWCYSFERMNGILGSFPNSHRQIEPELLRIIMQHWRLDDLISAQSNNTKLAEALKLIQPRATSGSLAANDNFEFAELCQFRKIFLQEVDDTIVGSEPFPGEMLTPCRNRVALPDNIYQILTDYYNNAYELQFVTIADSILNSSGNSIVVPNMVEQFGRVRIAAEIFGSAMSSRYLKNAFVLAKFIQNDGTTDLFPGQVQYYFEHTIRILGESKTHRLAFIRWYRKVTDWRIRFYTRIDENEESSNIELWQNDFCDLSRDCLIPIHYIYSRFVSCKFETGKKKIVAYKAVIPINRQFHL